MQFTVLSHAGTQRPLQPSSMGAWLLLELVVNLDIIHMGWFYRHAEDNGCGAGKASTQFSEYGLEARQYALEKALLGAVRVKLKVLWGLQEFGNARNVNYMLRKAIGSEWSQPK